MRLILIELPTRIGEIQVPNHLPKQYDKMEDFNFSIANFTYTVGSSYRCLYFTSLKMFIVSRLQTTPYHCGTDVIPSMLCKYRHVFYVRQMTALSKMPHHYPKRWLILFHILCVCSIIAIWQNIGTYVYNCDGNT